MHRVERAVTLFFLAAGFAWTGSAASAAESSDDLGAEYKKLLEMVTEKRKPVQTIDGSLGIADRPGIGPKNAGVILVEFGDFQCPYCRRHLLGPAQQIHEKLVTTGRLRYVFLDFPMEAKHPLARQAAVAAHCAEEQGKYWEMRNTLYSNQKALHEVFLTEHATTAGLDEAAFTTCLNSGDHDAAIREDKTVGESLGIRGTPTFFLGINQGDAITLIRRIQGAQPYEVFEREILLADEIAKQQQQQEHISHNQSSAWLDRFDARSGERVDRQ